MYQWNQIEFEVNDASSRKNNSAFKKKKEKNDICNSLQVPRNHFNKNK